MVALDSLRFMLVLLLIFTASACDLLITHQTGNMDVPSYSSLAQAVKAAQHGNTICYEAGALVYNDCPANGDGVVIDKTLTISVQHSVSAQSATIDCRSEGRFIWIKSPTSGPAVSVTVQGLELRNGRADFGGLIYAQV